MKHIIFPLLLLTVALVAAEPETELQMNFQQAPVDTVLDYLSRAAGFVIVRDAPILDKVDIVSHEPISRDEAVELLHGILNDRGYALIRNGRILRVVKKAEAVTQDLPVRSGSDPAALERSGELVTQVIPVRHTPATKLIDTLKPLLPAEAVVTANEDSNAIVVTDTLTNIRRMMQIIQALDTTVASILEIKVILLQHADAEETATVINKIFETPAAKRDDEPSDRRSRFFARMMRERMGGGEEDSEGGGDEARKTASHVNAVADTRANAVVITAPGDVMAQVQALVQQLDVATEATTALRVFPLTYADATEIATVLTNLYQNTTTQQTQQTSSRRRWFGPPRPEPQQQTAPRGSRTLAEAKVTAVADTRTNAVIVSASPGTMEDITGVVRELDATPANVPTVYIYRLRYADVERAQEILGNMFEDLDSTGGTGTRSGATGTAAGSIRRNTTPTTRPTTR